MKIILCMYLLISAIWDIRSQKLPAIWIWAGCVSAGGYAFWQILDGHRSVEALVVSLLPGIICYVFARISHALGEGDAWLILTVGLCLSIYELSKVLLSALFLSAVGAVLYLICTRKMKDRRIAFVPFLFLAVGMVLTG